MKWILIFQKVVVSILEVKIDVGWSRFYYTIEFRGKNKDGLEILYGVLLSNSCSWTLIREEWRLPCLKTLQHRWSKHQGHVSNSCTVSLEAMVSPIMLSARGRPHHLSPTCYTRLRIYASLWRVCSPIFFRDNSKALSGAKHWTWIGSRTPIRTQTYKEQVVKAILHLFSVVGTWPYISARSTLV